MFLGGSVQPGAVSCSTRVSAFKVTHCKCEILVTLKLFPNMSVTMGHIHIVKAGVLEELTVAVLKYLRSVSRLYVTQRQFFHCLGIFL